LALFLALGMMHVVLFRISRGGVLALGVTGALSFMLIPKRWTHYVMLLVVVLVGLRLAGPAVRARFFTSFATPEEEPAVSRDYRIRHWRACWDSMQTRPLGVGPAQWPLTCPQYGLPLGMAAHSTWLQVGAEEGMLGLVCLLGLYLVCVVRLWPLAWERVRPSD